ncbi:MAG: sensor histidine kinase [Vicinamibacteraceae bacterium]
MSLRGRLTAYVIVLHVIFAALAVVLLLRHPLWLFAVEAVFIISLVAGLKLTRNVFQGFSLPQEAARLMNDQELTTRLREVGQPELDRLIRVYNRMVDDLRGERTRLEEQHQFLAKIVQASPAGIIILDFDGRVSSINPAAERLFDAPAVEADIAPPKADATRPARGRQLAGLASPLAQHLAALHAGETRVFSLSGARRVRCHHGTFLDRGFRRSFLLIDELTEELRQFEKAAYEKLIRVMSHEVNNTVGASNSLLQSSLTYARELGEESRADFEQAIAIVIERTDQLNRFMRSFADVVRLPAPIKRPCDVLPMLEAASRLLSADPSNRGLTWRWDVRDPLRTIAMDRSQMEQALVNILKNAAEATGGKGTITLRLLRQNGRATVTIEDTGPGISPDVQTNLFTPFFSTKPGGQGIGLTLVQEILDAHGFEYALQGPPGGPSRFTIRMR